MKNRALTLFLLINLGILPKLFSQNVSINSTGNLPDTSAMLDVSSTTKGFLMPKMTTVQRDAIILPATGLAIFNTIAVAFQVNTGTPTTPVWSTLNSTAGSVSSVSVTTANGVSGSVLNPTTTPAISLTLGNITPLSVSATGTVSGSNLSGTNTGDETSASIKSKLGITTLSGSNTGDQTISLTGDVTGTGNGSFPATISANAVTYGKIQNVSAVKKLLGSSSTTTPVQEITLGTGLSLVGTTLTAAGSGGTVTSFGKTDNYGIISSVANPTTTPVHAIAVDTSLIASRNRLTVDSSVLATAINSKGTGSVTSVATGYGLSGGTIVTAGTLIVDSAALHLKFLGLKDSTIYTTVYQNSLKQAQINGTGFVKASGTGITYDNSTYLTANQPITLTGDVTGTGNGSFPATISSNAVTYGKIQNVSATGKLLGSSSTTTPVQEITLGTGLTLTGTTLSAAGSGGTVTSVSVIPANGFAGTVATPTTTPAITLTTSVSGMVLGTGTGLISATPGSDYSRGTAGNATGIVKSASGTGTLTTAVASDFPTLNQNTTGNAATVTTNANLTGPVTSVGNATTITDGVITNVKLANMPTNTIKGNNTGVTATAADLTVAQVNAMLPVFTPTLNGLVPFSGGVAGQTLHGDGTWKDTASSTNQWSILGNAGTTSATNFLGTTDLKSLKFKTNSVQGMILDSSGNVGIGTSPTFTVSNPEKLLVDAGSGSYNVISGKGNLNNFLQLNIKNTNAGTAASSDVVATNDAGTEANGINYVDMGINSSGYSAGGVLGGASNAYLYTTGNDFIIGNNTSGKPLRFFTTANSVSAEVMRIDSAGNVGIGTATPTAVLHVVKGGTGGLVIFQNTNAAGYSSADFLSNTGALAGTFGYANSGTGGAFASKDYFNSYGNDFNFVNGSTSDIYIKASNNFVGIGTATPGNKLQVIGTDPLSLLGVQAGTNTSTDSVLTITGGVVKKLPASIFALSASTNQWSITGNTGISSITNFLGTTDSKSLRFRTNNVQAMILDSLGNVAVGTAPVLDVTNPEKLLVNAGATTSVNAIVGKGSINSYLQLNIQNQSAGTGASSDVVATANNGNETSNYMDMGINGGSNTSGVMGVMNDAYLYNLGQNLFIGTGTPAKSLIFMTGGTDSAANGRMRIDGSGNVGIANVAPTEKLDVTGNVKFSGALMPNNLPGTAGSFLTSNGAGASPTWSTAISGTNTGDVTIGTANGLSLTGQALSLSLAGTATTGALSSTDWNTFNNKAGAANVWSITGNGGTSASTNFIGTTDAQDLVFKANNTERLRIVNGVSAPTGTTGDITLGDANSGTVRTTKEFVMREDGDLYGPSVLRLRNRTGENGAIFETIGTSANLVDFIFKTGTVATPIVSNLRFETRTGSEFGTGNTTEWQIGQPGAPTMVISAASSGNSALLIGNFGINNLSPSEKLDVSGNIKFSGALMPNNLPGTAGNILTSAGPGTAPTWTTPGNQTITFAPTGDVTGTTTGITTIAPVLAIGTNKVLNSMLAQMPTLTIKGNNTGGTANAADLTVAQVNAILPVFTATLNGLVPFSGGSAGQILHGDGTWKDTTATTNQWSITGNTGISPITNFLGTTDSKSLRFRTNNVQAMILDSLGNVAVGTAPVLDVTNPEKLLVNAGATTSVNAIVGKGSINSYLQLNIQNQSAGTGASSDVVATANNGNETSNYMDMGINGGSNTSGVMGVMNDAYLYNLGQNLFIGTGTPAKSLIFMTGGTDSAANGRMRIDGSGNVGIANVAPTEKLDVTGNVKFSGALMPNNLPGTAGSFLTSNGAGASPTWSTAISGTNTGDVTIGTANGLSLTGQALSLSLAGTATTGALSSTDWNTFNNKVATISITGSPVFATTALLISLGAASGNLLLNTHAKNTFFAGPVSGADSVPSFRVLTATDLPNGTATTTNTWTTTGNSGTTSTTNFIGTKDKKSFVVKSWGNQGIILDSLGSVGIGSSPTFTAPPNRERLLVDAGTSDTTNFTNVISGKGYTNNYLQMNIQNRSNGSGASSDVVATSDLGNESVGYIDMGINSSGYSSLATPILSGTNTAYLYATGTDFVIGNVAVKPIRFFTGGVANSNERLRIDSSGNVGIGNIVPSEKLDVTGNLKFSGALMPNNLPGTAGNILTSAGPGTAPTWTAPGNQTITFAPTGDVTGTTTGTTSIAPVLAIGTNKVLNSMLAQMPTHTIKGNNTGGTANAADLTIAQVNAILPVFTATLNGLVPFSGGSAGQILHGDGTWKDTTATTNQWSITGNTGISPITNFLGTTDSKSLRFRTNNVQAMILDSLGNVAVGTAPVLDVTNPEKLLVNAGATTSVNAIVGKGSINSYLQLNIQNQSAGTGASSDVVATANNGNETSNYMDMGINGGSNTSGVMGVMNDAYLYNLGQNLFIGTGTPAKSLIFMTGGTDSAANGRMRIDSSGNVGIATASPAARLDVAGTYKLGTAGTVLNSMIHTAVSITDITAVTTTTRVETVALPGALVDGSVIINPKIALPAGLVIAYARISSAGQLEVGLISTGSVVLGSNFIFDVTIIQ